MSDISVRMTLKDEVSSKLDKIKSSATTTARQFSNAGKAMDEAFHSSAASDFASQAESAFSSATSGAEALGDAINEVNSAYDDLGSSAGAYQDVNGRWHDANGKFIKSLGTTGEKIKDIDETLSGLGDDTGGLEGLSSQIGDAGTSMEQASAHAINFGSALKTLFAVAGGATVLNKIKEFGVESVDTFSGLQTGMAEVSTLISGSTKAEMAGMTSQVREFSLNTGKLTEEIVPALYQSISASVPKENVFDFLGTANMAAVGGVTDVETAVDGITSVINAYGTENLSAAQASDQMFTAVKLGKTTFGELAGSLYNVIPTAVNAGVTFGDITAAIATMTASGTPTSVATTQMRQALVELSDTGTDVGETFQSIAGKSFKEFIAEGHNTSEALNLLDEHAKTSGLSIDQLFSSVEAGNAAAQLTGINAKVFADDIVAMGESAGATEEAYNKMTDTFQHKKDLLAAAFEDVKIDSGEALAEGLSPAIDGLLENMDEIKEPTVEFFSAIGDIIADLAPLLPGFLNTLSNGAEALGDVIGPLAKLMANNPEAIGTGLTGIATGMMAFKGLNAASGTMKSLEGVKGLSGALSKLAPTIFSNPWAAGAAAVVGAVTSVGFAIHEYNDQKISNSLAEHFGDVELTAKQIESVAGHILNAKYLVDIDAALNEFRNADQFASEVEDALAKNDTLEWKASIGMTWDENEVTQYVANIDDFIESSVEELESRSYAATVTVKTMLGGTEEGQTLASQMEQWAAADELEMSKLSQQLKSAVEKAMEDGVLTANEQAAITILQNKMNHILSSWKEADAQAQLDLIDQKYGSASGKDLTEETFGKVVEELGNQRKEAQESLDESYTALMSTMHGLDNSGRLQEAGISFEKLETQAGNAYRNAQAGNLVNSIGFENRTLSDTYGDLLQENYDSMEASTQKFIDDAKQLFSAGDAEGVFSSLSAGRSQAMESQSKFNIFADEDQLALQDRWAVMKEDVSAMQSLMDEYRETGQKIPQEFMNSYNEAMMLGAAAGDSDAAWHVLASQMVEGAGGVEEALNDSLISSILNGTQAVPAELRDALSVALAETTNEPLSMEDVAVSLAGFDLDVSQISELTGMTEEEVTAALEKMDIETETKVDVKTKAGTVDESGITEAGKQAEEVAKSESGEPVEVEKPAKTILTDAGTDDSQISQAAQEQEKIAEPEERQIPTTIKFEVASLDDSALSSAISEKLKQGEAVPVDVPANITVKAGTIDSSPAVAKVQSDVTNAFTSAFPADGTVDVTLAKGSDNIGEVYDYVGGLVRSAWANPYSASGMVNVTLTANYSLANPTKTIEFGGGATGSATVSAALHAEGGIFDTPHYGVFAEAGPEAFIPIDGSDNAKEIWQETGIRLGVLQEEAPISIPPAHATGTARSNESDTGSGSDAKSSSREINLNINGSGNMRIDGGVQKEDVLNMMIENIKDVLLGIIEQEILEEGDGVYEY